MSNSTTIIESPLFVTGPRGPLFAITTSPSEPTGSVVICPGGWHAGNANSNQMLVRVARKLAQRGFASVRFDWEGTGETPGDRAAFILDEPSPGEALAAAELVESPSSIVGICFGSRSALAAAPNLPQLEKMVLVSFPLPAARAKARRAERIGTMAAIKEGLRPSTLKGWMDPATRRVYRKFISLRWQKLRSKLGLGSTAGVKEATERKAKRQTMDIANLVQQLEALADRGVKVLFLFGTGDALYDQFAAARNGPLGDLLNRHPDLFEATVVEGDLTGFSTLDVQASLIDQVVNWLAPAPSPPDLG